MIRKKILNLFFNIWLFYFTINAKKKCFLKYLTFSNIDKRLEKDLFMISDFMDNYKLIHVHDLHYDECSNCLTCKLI